MGLTGIYYNRALILTAPTQHDYKEASSNNSIKTHFSAKGGSEGSVAGSAWLHFSSDTPAIWPLHV